MTAPADSKRRHPPGLATLFYTEMWERFTYYGMRAILILFMVAAVADGGLGLDDRTASAIYGLYISTTFVSSLFGGWIGDRLTGHQRGVIAGGLLIVVGNALLLFEHAQTFFLGLLVIVLGVGLLKPNISVMVGHLYPEGGSRRDAGFSMFFMGINIGAFLGGLAVPLCAARFGWHCGFALPVAGMSFGLVQFILTRHRVGLPTSAVSSKPLAWLPVVVAVAALVLVVALVSSGRLRLDAVAMAAAASRLIAFVAAGYFVYLVAFAGLTSEERKRIYIMAALFVATAMFYAGSEQAGASFNLFAERYMDRNILGWQMPAGVLQATTALYVILFAPAFAALWLALGRRGRDPLPTVKFAVGLTLLSVGFLVMYVAAHRVMGGIKVLPTWLLFTYLIIEWGDLCLSPVGLSSMTQLAPQRFGGQIMGLFYFALGLGNNFAGQLSLEYDANRLETLPQLFLKISGWGLAGAAGMLLITPVVKRLMPRRAGLQPAVSCEKC
jgi:proton-dependent oligopeptide transporter, POT family